MYTVLQIAHESEDMFKDAKTFNPNRFINTQTGKLNLSSDTSLPFGVGSRTCPGETFTRNILFLFLAAILQNFTITVPDGHKMPDPALEVVPIGVVKVPPVFWLKFETR